MIVLGCSPSFFAGLVGGVETLNRLSYMGNILDGRRVAYRPSGLTKSDVATLPDLLHDYAPCIEAVEVVSGVEGFFGRTLEARVEESLKNLTEPLEVFDHPALGERLLFHCCQRDLLQLVLLDEVEYRREDLVARDEVASHCSMPLNTLVGVTAV